MDHWITSDGRPGPTGEGGFPALGGRYVLIVAYPCPWASRALMAWRLKALSGLVDVIFAQAEMGEEGWCFAGDQRARLASIGLDVADLRDVYRRADPRFSGRANVPVLWDIRRGTIVNHESSDVLRMLGSAFSGIVDAGPDLYPEDIGREIDALNAAIQDDLNLGVYKAGLSVRQVDYEDACRKVFDMLDQLEERLSTESLFMFGDRLTETDIRLFVTLIRFDPVYCGLFKCNLRRLIDYRFLNRYTARMMQVPGIAETVAIDQIKLGYHSNPKFNPNRIVALGPRRMPGFDVPAR